MTLTSHMIMIHQAPAHWRCTMLTSWQRRVVSLSAVSSTEWEHLGSSTRAMMMLPETWVSMIKPWLSSGSRTTSGASMETVTRSHCLERVQVSHGIMVTVSIQCCSGAGSVSTHLISPVSRHIAKRAVLQSGAINAPWSNLKPEKSKQISDKLISDCQCERETVRDTMRCMRSLPASNISVSQWNSYWGILGFPSSPTVDGEFLPR